MAVLALRAAGAGSIQPTGCGTTPVRDGPCGVQEAVLVAARIDHNPDNMDYVAYCVRRFPDRMYQFADVDCMWTPTNHTPGAAERLAEAVCRYNLRAFTTLRRCRRRWIVVLLRQWPGVFPHRRQPELDRQHPLAGAAPAGTAASGGAVPRHAVRVPPMAYPVAEQAPDGAAPKEIKALARRPNIVIKLCPVVTMRHRLAGNTRTPRVHSSGELSTSTSGPTDCTGAPIIRSYAGR